MKTALLDTHVLIWFLEDDPRLSTTARGVIAPRSNRVLLSAASVWEMAIKIGSKRLELSGDPLEVSSREGIEPLEITMEHAWANRSLPVRRDHRDPFDRMIAAQAICEGIPVISADPSFDALGAARIW